jgi:hypothetical protein
MSGSGKPLAGLHGEWGVAGHAGVEEEEIILEGGSYQIKFFTR